MGDVSTVTGETASACRSRRTANHAEKTRTAAQITHTLSVRAARYTAYKSVFCLV